MKDNFFNPFLPLKKKLLITSYQPGAILNVFTYIISFSSLNSLREEVSLPSCPDKEIFRF